MTTVPTPVPGDASEVFYAAITEHVLALAHAIDQYAHAGSEFDPAPDVREQTAEHLVMDRLFDEFAALRANMSGRDAQLMVEVRDEVLEHHVLDRMLPKLLESRAAVVGLAGGDVATAMDREAEGLRDRVTLAAYTETAQWVESAGPGEAGV